MKTTAVIQSLTNRGKAAALLNLSVIIVMALILSGCHAHSPQRHGHPHHDHHNRADTQVSIAFSYYPSLHVYYNRHRNIYHYHDKYRGWLSVRVLPPHIRIHGKRHHIIHSKHNTPWKSKHRYKRSHSHIDPHHHKKRNRYKDKHDRRDHDKRDHDRSRW